MIGTAFNGQCSSIATNVPYLIAAEMAAIFNRASRDGKDRLMAVVRVLWLAKCSEKVVVGLSRILAFAVQVSKL